MNRLTRIWKQYDEWVDNSHKRTAISSANSGVFATFLFLLFLSKQPVGLVTVIVWVVIALSAGVMWFRAYESWQLHKKETIEKKR
ncbi:MAG: hypothetical protein J4G19_06735 [Pseudomonadales bacterium]|nr:hypothetical protein [Pseudomonadales bacterium]